VQIGGVYVCAKDTIMCEFKVSHNMSGCALTVTSKIRWKDIDGGTDL
jgi:hypothetical protein